MLRALGGWTWAAPFVALLVACSAASAAPAGTAPPSTTVVVVAGSVNLDTTISMQRLPLRGETVTALSSRATTAVGGKGANQARGRSRNQALHHCWL